MLDDDSTKVRDTQPIEQCELSDLREWYPKTRHPTDGTFEIGLVLAGAVSAGAYSAGVMDFLFEALDQWHKHRTNDSELPQHKVKIRVIAGASAGGMNGAIAAAACRYAFPPITTQNADQDGSRNPFFNAWVKSIDVQRLLDVADLKNKKPLLSLLNSECLDEIAREVIATRGDPARETTRAWLADPFKLLLAVTNLQGVPYEVRFVGNTEFGHEMITHADYMGFSVPVFQRERDAPPDLVRLGLPNGIDGPGWKTLAVTTLATGAFPLVLASRRLRRPGSDYDYRFIFPHAPQGLVYSPAKIEDRRPYSFIAVDGGAMNNEPFGLAHTELAGLAGRNPREGNEADRAIIMIDPFTDPRGSEPGRDVSIPKVALRLAGAFKTHARFRQIDLTLAAADDVYSRFMIAPRRDRSNGGHASISGRRAIASGGMRAFLGFFCEAYREHDYMLGRRNCQAFLRNWFVLPPSNPLFGDWPQGALENDDFKSQTRQDHRQIIPLVGTAVVEQALPSWPSDKFAYSAVKTEIENRVGKLRPLLQEMIGIHGWVFKSIAWLVWHAKLKRKIIRGIEEMITSAIREIDFVEVDASLDNVADGEETRTSR